MFGIIGERVSLSLPSVSFYICNTVNSIGCCHSSILQFSLVLNIFMLCAYKGYNDIFSILF